MGSAHQQFSLRWNNYSSHITNALDDLRAEDELTDVTLAAEGMKIRAHKLLLSACSTFFRETFRENPCQHPVIILKGVSFVDLQAVVTFMYNGQVNVTQDRLSCFLQTAEMLQIKGLTDMNDDKHNNDEDLGQLPPPSIPRHGNSNANAKKRLIATAHNPETVQQHTPTPKRRKFIPSTAQGVADGLPGGGVTSSSNAGSAYNSPGPSSTTNSGGNSHVLNNHHNSNNHNSDSNSNSAVGGGSGGDDGDDLYPATMLDDGGMLKYEPDDDLNQGGGGEDGDGLMIGDEDDEFRNDCSEDGDNSMQDYAGMEQGAIDCDGRVGEGGGEGEEDETEVMVLEGGGYNIIAYSDSEDPTHDRTHLPLPTKISLSPPRPPPHTQPPSAPTAAPWIFTTAGPPKSVTDLLKAQSSSSRSSFSSTTPTSGNINICTPSFSSLAPNSIPTPTSHINILRKKRTLDPAHQDLEPLINPLELGSTSRIITKASSPFVGDPMMDPETGETMHPCLMCDKRYRLKSSLESHVKIHEGSENTCSVCGQTMSRQRDLKRHVATVHRGLLMPDGITITYPPNIDELVPVRARKGRTRPGDGGGGSDQDQGSSSNDYYSLDNPFFNLHAEPH